MRLMTLTAQHSGGSGTVLPCVAALLERPKSLGGRDYAPFCRAVQPILSQPLSVVSTRQDQNHSLLHGLMGLALKP